MSSKTLLPEGWRWASIQETCATGKSIVSGPFGSSIGRRFFVDAGVPVIRGNNLSTGMEQFIDDGFVFLSLEKANEFKSHEAVPGDLIFTAAGTIGQVGLIPKQPQFQKYIISNKQLRARFDPNVIDAQFAYYWFSSPKMVKMIQSRNTGSTIPLINLSVLRSLPVPVPPLREQALIARYLTILDDRIALLRETNKTLETIAQAIFKSWFVDFDPVRAKMEGRQPEGMDEATAALFPDSFEESELGLVPKGWNTTRLDSVLELKYGKALKADNRKPGAIPVYGSGGITGWHDTAFVEKPSIIVGRKGTVGSLYWESRPFFPIDTVFYVHTNLPLTYCYQLLKTLNLHDMNTDAAVPGLNRDNVYRLLVPSPPLNVLSIFNEIADSLRRRIDHNEEEARNLAEIRDTLLPRLISGQLRLPDAQDQIENA